MEHQQPELQVDGEQQVRGFDERSGRGIDSQKCPFKNQLNDQRIEFEQRMLKIEAMHSVLNR